MRRSMGNWELPPGGAKLGGDIFGYFSPVARLRFHFLTAPLKESSLCYGPADLLVLSMVKPPITQSFERLTT
jgi:hypothetical protein